MLSLVVEKVASVKWWANPQPLWGQTSQKGIFELDGGPSGTKYCESEGTPTAAKWFPGKVAVKRGEREGK